MKKTRELFEFPIIAAGSILCAFALNTLLLPHGITVGGYSGIASAAFFAFGLPVSLGVALLNLPTFIFAYKILGRRAFYRSAFGLGVFLVFESIIPVFSMTKDIFLSTVFGGALMGIGLGANIIFGGSTGGTDLLALMINKKMPSMRVSTAMFIIDAVAVALTAAACGLNAAMYSLIAVFAVIEIVEIISSGRRKAHAFFIITDSEREVIRQIYASLERGVTMVSAVGGYSNEKKTMLLCTVSSVYESEKLKKAVNKADKAAFVFSVDAREVLGEGF